MYLGNRVNEIILLCAKAEFVLQLMKTFQGEGLLMCQTKNSSCGFSEMMVKLIPFKFVCFA